MAEAEDLCDRIVIIVKGKVSITGTPEQITAAAGISTNIMIRTAKGCLIKEGIQNSQNNGYVKYTTENTADFLMELLQKVKDCGDTVYDLRVERPSLEERFLEIVKGGKSE
jgi:ABC-2 type transport system ATP-binding protein